jgi:hypothetical protein
MDEGIEIYGFSETPKISHAAQRAKERYGVELTNEDLQKISDICQGKTWRRDYQKPLGFDKHHIHVNYKDIWWNLVYSSSTKMIVTILHPKADPTPKVEA